MYMAEWDFSHGLCVRLTTIPSLLHAFVKALDILCSKCTYICHGCFRPEDLNRDCKFLTQASHQCKPSLVIRAATPNKSAHLYISDGICLLSHGLQGHNRM